MAYKFNPFTGNLDEVGAGGGGGGTPGGADTQVQFNDGGAFGGDAGLTYDKTTDKLTVGGDIDLDDGGTFSTTLQTVTPTANRTVSIPDATGTIGLVNGPTGSIQFNQAGALKGTSDFSTSLVWDSATTFTGLKLNVTDTAGAADSKLLDLQINGTSRFNVDSFGTANVFVQAGFTNEGLSIGATNSSAKTKLSFSDGLFFSGTGTYDIVLRGDGSADTLAQRRGTNAQTYRLYNTYTDASNFERTSITRDSSGLVIDAQKGGTGVDPTNLLDLQLDGASKFKFDKFGINYGVASAITTYIGLGSSYGSTNGFRLYGDTTTLRFASNHIVGWTANPTESFTTLDTALVRDSAGVVKVTDGSTGTGYLKLIPTTVGALTAAATVGAGTKAFVNDANATTFASVVAGGGSNVVPVYSDGTDWRIG